MNARFWRWPLATQMLTGLVLGIAIGLVLRRAMSPDALGLLVSHGLGPVGSLFLRVILMTVVPLIFAAIVLGVVELGDGHKLGVIGLKTMLCASVFAAFSVVVALTLVNLVRPGLRLDPARRAALVADYSHGASGAAATTAEKKPLLATVIEFIPTNPLAEATTALNPTRTGGGIIGVMIFAVFVGIAARAAGRETRAFRELCENVFDVMMQIIGFAMRLAPFCVLCLTAVTAARLGNEIFGTLGLYVGVVLGGLLVEAVTLYPLALWFFARRSPLTFLRQTREAIITAFTTASSNATMPVSMRVAETQLRVPRPIARFVVILGAACNHNGSALFEAVTVLFLAQLFGLDLSLGLQLQVALLCMLSSVGAGGVPGGGIAMTATVMASIGLPPGALAIVLGVDRILDMTRTAVNVTGDLVIATVVARDASAENSPLGTI
jgi:dicarboxylate/amino acid:cation (Na+ or H+) symporter, DAACS family